MTRLAPDMSGDLDTLMSKDGLMSESGDTDADGGTGRAGGARPSGRHRARGPVRTIARLTIGGLIAMMLALGFVAGGHASTAQAKGNYLSKKYHHPKYGQTSKAVRNLQLRLADVGLMKEKYATSYYGPMTRKAVQNFRSSAGMKRGSGKKISKKAWKKLVAKSGKVKKPSSHNSGGGNTKASGIAKACKVNGRVMCIDKTQRKLRYMVDGKVKKTVDARFGCAVSPTREGVWHVFRKVRHDVSYQYHSAMPLSMYFSGGEAVHYSSDFAARGYAGCSHGCVNIRDRNTLRYIYNHIKLGDRVVVYWS